MLEEGLLLALRDEFPTLADSHHFVSHSLGAMPRRAREHATAFLDAWQGKSIEAWHDWLPYVDSLGDRIASILGAPAGTVTLNQNVSTICALVASCFDFRGERRKVVLSDLDFSTVIYAWREQARRGADVCVVPSEPGALAPSTERLLEAIDERTLIVPISHVFFRSSAMLDVQAVVRRAHQVGALVMLDCYQTTGAMPIRLDEWGVDLACGGSVKWVCGGPGLAYLYARPEVRARLTPMNTGWFGHAEPFAFDLGPMRYADDAWRLAAGTHAIPALYTATAGWETMERIASGVGFEAARRKSLRQTALLRSLAERRGFEIRTPRDDAWRGGTMCFDFPDAGAVTRELNQRRFFCDHRPQCGLRASPHFYTTDDEIVRFMDEIDRIRAGR